MNSIQRAGRSVIRKPVKSILLLLVIMVISLFFLAGMSSKNASVAAQDKTRQAIGASLRLEENEANRHTRMEKLSAQLGEREGSVGGYSQRKIQTAAGTSWLTYVDSAFETLKIEDVKKIAAVSGITSYNLTTAATAVNPVNFDRIEDNDVDQHSDMGGVNLIGNKDMAQDLNVISGNVTISNGRMIVSEDEDVCVISEELAAQNNLQVGDELQFNDYHDIEGSTIYPAKIIGIYKTVKKMTAIMSGDTYRSENTIFTDLRFPEKAEGKDGDPLFQYAYFQVADVNQYDAIKAAVKKVDIDWVRYDLIDNNGNLETMSSNFNDLEKISSLLLIVVAIASFVILLLIFVFWMKGRTHEMGILLSMGITKKSILGQMLLEALIIAMLAFSLSFIAAPVVSNTTANYLVEQQVKQTEIRADADTGKVFTDTIQTQQTVTGVNVEITKQMIIADGLGIILLISVSILTAGISILKKNPKNILSEMS